jgi:hypothetical protein
MSKVAELMPLMDDDEIVAANADELRRLHELFLEVAPTLGVAGRFAEAIATALETHRELVLVVDTSDRAAAQRQAVQDRLETLIEQMTPPVDLVSEAAAVLSQRNGQRRAELLSEFGALTGEQIADERSRARNRHALAARWRKEGRLFGVPYEGQTVYPTFQFDAEGNLRTVVADVLERLPIDRMSPWEVALWWTASNGWLRGRRPVDLLDEEDGALLDAAQRLAEPSPL